MSTLNDLDLGPSHSWLATRVGQVMGTALIEGAKTIVWPRGRTLEEQPTQLYVTPWQAIGGSGAGSRQAMLYLLRQLEELAGNPDMQPLYTGWTTTAAGGAFNQADGHDGWYVVGLVQPPYRRYVVTGGSVQAPATVALVAPGTPSSLAVGWSGAALSSTYSATPVPLIPFPVGSTLAPATALSRTGGEGAVPLSILTSASVLNPTPFTRPGTVAGLFTGAAKVYDTSPGGIAGNAVPAAPTFVNANWFRVYGTQHDWAGDTVITNGLLLLVLTVGATFIPVYVWNTSLGTPGWQQAGTINYNDSGFNFGAIREVNLERVGIHEVRTRIVMSTSAGNYARFVLKLQAGQYACGIDYYALTEANGTQFALRWALTNAGKIMYNEAVAQDMAVTANATLASSLTKGFGATFGQTANGPLIGWLYQNAPSANQPGGGSANTDVALGDASGPAVNTFRRYAFFAVPFTTAQNLQAEAESGTLGTGWSSVADAAASGGNTAKVASGTASGNADLFGTSWQPPTGLYDIWFRVKVTSAANTTAQLQIGWWDVTAAAFVAGGSTIYAPSQWTTSYTWARANSRTVADGVTNGTTTVTSATAIFTSADVGKSFADGFGTRTTIFSVTNATTAILSTPSLGTGSSVTFVIGTFNNTGGGLSIAPPAGHNLQFRAVTTGTLATDFFIDEAALAPIMTATLGQGSFPGDIWSQWMFDLDRRWVRG